MCPRRVYVVECRRVRPTHPTPYNIHTAIYGRYVPVSLIQLQPTSDGTPNNITLCHIWIFFTPEHVREPQEKSSYSRMGDFSDEVGAVSDQMRMMRMMAAAGGSSASAAPAPAPAPAPLAKPAGKPRLIEKQLFVLHVAFKVCVSLPPGYVESGSDRFNTLYVLDREQSVFSRAADAAAAAYASVGHLENRNWYPELIVVTAHVVPPPNSGANWLAANKPTPKEIIDLMSIHLLDYVERTFRVEPFAAGRAICGFGGDGRAAAHAALQDADKLKLFHHVLIGSPEADDESTALQGGPPLEGKSAVCFLVGRSESSERLAMAKACHAALEARTDKTTTATVMTVDRTGEQHYASETGLGVAVDLLEIDGGAGSTAIIEGAIRWLGERLEKRKLERLGSLLPWHEFK